MPLVIPEEQKESVAALIELADEKFARLTDAVSTASPTISIRLLADQIAPATDIKREELGGILVVLVSLLRTRSSTGKSTDALAKDLVDAAASEGLGGLALDSEISAKFLLRLSDLLNRASVLDLTGRALDVYTAHERLFQACRVLTDIRPVFSADNPPRPLAGTIVHTLELQLAVDGEQRDQYVAMNVHDLRELKSAVDRALEKERTLQGVIKSLDWPVIEDAPNPHQAL